MAEEVLETPEISEDESYVETSSKYIIDSSMVENEGLNESAFEDATTNEIQNLFIEMSLEKQKNRRLDLKSKLLDFFLKNIAGKKNNRVIQSDTSEAEEEFGSASDHSLSRSFENGNIYNSTKIAPRTSRGIEKSYRESLPVIDSRSPSPDSRKSGIINISSDDEYNADDFVVVNEAVESVNVECSQSGVVQNNESKNVTFEKPLSKIEVSHTEYQSQKQKVQTLNFEVHKTKGFIRVVNLNNLPDKGQALINKLENLIEEATMEEEKLNAMIITKDSKPEDLKLKPKSWEELQAAMSSVQPRTFGRQAMETLNMQKALTLDRLEQLHGSLKSCPTPDVVSEDPKGLKVELLPHQKHALAWLMWRENQKPRGGILADDMGLGKTLTMISLTLKIKEMENSDDTENESDEDDSNPDRKNYKYPGGTLVVCPASLIYQWEAEVKKHVKKGLIAVELYHGVNRETKAKRLARQDMVITTYSLAMGDYNKLGPLFKVKWQRVILDEAHQVRNHKSQTSVAVCNLGAKTRWVLTGTPVHNKELDLYALLKFLRCSPFDDLTVWKRWVANKSAGGQDRLNTVMSSLILRRTKQQLAEKKMLTCLPEKIWTLIEITLDKQETSIYQKVLIFSRTLFAQFLHQRAEQNADSLPTQRAIDNPNGEYFKMHQKLLKVNRVQKIKQHEILVLLLRLRQICCHPSLITSMLQKDEHLMDSDVEDCEEINLLEQLNRLKLDDDVNDIANGLSSETEVGLAEASRNLLNPANPVFAENRRSSKLKTVMKLIKESTSEGDKIVVISQWTKLLQLLTIQLKEDKIPYFQLDGSVPVNKRMEIVVNINNPEHNVKVLLLSLTAGGVGLNLVGANHLLLLDLHWNPQLEMQAQDRIYRVGQTKPVKIYKLMAVDTIEQRIKALQDKKLNLAEELLTGAKIQQNKLSLQDLKMLFNM